jgi:hypothetical protein
MFVTDNFERNFIYLSLSKRSCCFREFEVSFVLGLCFPNFAPFWLRNKKTMLTVIL